MNFGEKQYFEGTYLQANLDWDSSESLWRAGLVCASLGKIYLTDAYRTDPGLTLKSKIAGLIKRVVCAFVPQGGPGLLGGQTLIVLARGAKE